MILVDNRTYPLNKVHFPYRHNTVLVCPWTGELWARIDRGYKEWYPIRLPRRGSPGWPSFDGTTVPGSLYSSYEVRVDNAFEELPRDLLIRELSVLEELTRATLSGYNCATNGDYQMTPDLLKEIAVLRTKVEIGTITDEELRSALKKMREGRVNAVRASATKRASAAAKTNPDDALAAFLS